MINKCLYTKSLCLIISLMLAINAYSLTADKIYQRVSGSTYKIFNISVENNDLKINGSGSAVAISKDLLVTNCHVVKGGEFIGYKRNGAIHPGKVIYRNIKDDICVAKVPDGEFNPVKIARSSQLRIGQTVYAVGSPGVHENVMTPGIISGLKKFGNHTLIMTSARISHGSSGGGLYNENGELIGLTTAYDQRQHYIAYAVPLDWVLNLLIAHNLDSEVKTPVATHPTLVSQSNENKKFENVSLIKYQSSCLLSIAGVNDKGRHVSNLLFFPRQPYYLFFVSTSVTIEQAVTEAQAFLSSTRYQKQQTQNYVILNKRMHLISVVTTPNMSRPIYTAIIDHNPKELFISGSHFVARFLARGAHHFNSLDFSLYGFTDAYKAWVDECGR